MMSKHKNIFYSVGDLVFVKDDTKNKGTNPKLQTPWKGPLIVSECCGPVHYEFQGLKQSKIMQLKPYNSEVVPAWVKCQRNQVLQQCQDLAVQLLEEDVQLAPRVLLQKNINEVPKWFVRQFTHFIL